MLTVGTYCHVADCRRGRLGGARRLGAHGGRRGAVACRAGRLPTACYCICLKCLKSFNKQINDDTDDDELVLLADLILSHRPCHHHHRLLIRLRNNIHKNEQNVEADKWSRHTDHSLSVGP